MDLDGDGRLDVLSGSYSRMEQDMAGLFQVLAGQEDGTFAKAEVLKGTDGEPLILSGSGALDDDTIDRICTRPTAADLDGDGDLDIVSGNFAGTFAVFQGAGQGRFAPESTYLRHADGDLLKVAHHSDPFLVDWDGDGDLDLLSGSSEGDVSLFVNTGSARAAVFAKPVVLLEIESAGHTLGEGVVFGDAHVAGPQGSTRVFAADVSGDGKLDLLVGDSVRLTFPAEGLSEEESRAAMERWDAAFQELMQSAPEVDYENFDSMSEEQMAAFEAHQERVGEMWDQRSKFVREDGTGQVWLYVQR